jgi:hypothetical protein
MSTIGTKKTRWQSGPKANTRIPTLTVRSVSAIAPSNRADNAPFDPKAKADTFYFTVEVRVLTL